MKTTNYLIESMIDSTLGVDDMYSLKGRLLNDKSLQNEVKLRKEVNAAIIEEDIGRLTQCLDYAKNAYEASEFGIARLASRSRARQIFYAAAAISGMAVGGLALYSALSQPNNPDQLYREFFAPYPPTYVAREAFQGTSNLTFDKAMAMYQRAKHKEAAESLYRLKEQHPNSVTVKFYLAITLMQLNEFEQANYLFDEVISRESLYSVHAKWYKGLSYLATDDISQAKRIFAELANTEGELGNQSIQILKQLED
jgi:predicted Zn-dependent protease